MTMGVFINWSRRIMRHLEREFDSFLAFKYRWKEESTGIPLLGLLSPLFRPFYAWSTTSVVLDL